LQKLANWGWKLAKICKLSLGFSQGVVSKELFSFEVDESFIVFRHDYSSRIFQKLNVTLIFDHLVGLTFELNKYLKLIFVEFFICEKDKLLSS